MADTDSSTRDTCVVIAARNAAPFIGRAVASALDQPEIVEVVVVDDASTDGTAEAAKAADDARLRVMTNEANIGPAASRNLAIAASRAPNIAVLDADDFFLPGRLASLYATSRWDVIADDIVFLHDPEQIDGLSRSQEVAPSRHLDLRAFLKGNRPVRGRQRGEFGFLKPVFKRRFLQETGITYREDLRLGEDFEIMVRLLAAGARVKLSERCGYGALIRPDSLSASHRTEDLARLAAADHALLKTLDLSKDDRYALEAHHAQITARLHHGQFLDAKRRGGFSSAVRAIPFRALPGVSRRIAEDKLMAFFHSGDDVRLGKPHSLFGGH